MTIIEDIKSQEKYKKETSSKIGRRATHYLREDSILWVKDMKRIMRKPSSSGLVQQLIDKAKDESWEPK